MRKSKEQVAGFIKMSPTIADEYLVVRAKGLMAERLAEQRAKGFGGWNTKQCNNVYLHKLLAKNLLEGDLVDALNLITMILIREEFYGEEA